MKFLLTRELGRLARWLRILGFDTVYFNQDNSSSLIIQALRDNRIILTRNHRLPKSTGIKIVLVKAQGLKEQLAEVSKTLKIPLDSSAMFSRCIICNEELVEIEKGQAAAKVPEYVLNTQEHFLTCPNCKRIYWSGTHWGNVAKILEEINR